MDDYLDSPMDSEDVFPCKGCGEILEEGKAFELAGNRWHLDCFRCNTCNTLLDSDANLLLLGDGSLICNNCTYSCSACGNKIEDLAILTGDQAFCATCFRCRNCKRKIENLRYARTSQGIFCMNCHESLMARRRKKSKAAAQAKAREKDGSPMITDKSLPALPPNAIPPNAFSNERVTPESDTPTELSPRPRPPYGRNDSSSRSSSRRPDQSPERPAQEPTKDSSALAPPAQSYRNNRNSTIISGDLSSIGGDADGFFIPVALDPSPAPSVAPRSTSDALADSKKKEYFNSTKQPPADKKSDSQASTPHIAFQEKGRQPSSDFESPQNDRPTRKLSKKATERNGQPKAPPSADHERKGSSAKTQGANNEEFKLQDAPKSKKLVSPRNNSQSGMTTGVENGAPSKPTNGSQQRNKDAPPNPVLSDSPPLRGQADKLSTPRSSQDGRIRDDDEIRPSIDSLHSSRSDITSSKPIARKELPPSAARTGAAKPPPGPSAKSAAHEEQTGSPSQPGLLARPQLPETKMSDTYMQPRAPPQPPTHAAKESISSTHVHKDSVSSVAETTKLPRWSSGGDFSLDEDMARILGTDEGSSSILRRVSNAVRHGRNNSSESTGNQHGHGRLGHSRSVSETTRGTTSPRWPKTPIAENRREDDHGHEISSPISLAGGAALDDPALLKRQLRNSEQRVAELERQFNTEKDLKNLNKKLIEKRKTVSVLDTQTEIMIRQLEVLAGYVERAKKTQEPLDPQQLEDSAIKEFVQKMEKLKHTMTASIEQLHAERDELMEEKNQAVADRDRALLEFEQLSSKNAQLADLNNDLTHQIQERFKQQINNNTDLRSPNGLGIYSHTKGVSSASVNNLDASSLQTGSTMVGTDVEESVVEGPTVVNIRKGQVRKFNWKKGSSKVAHNITKGINRAAVAFQQQEQNRPQQQQGGLTGDNIGMPYNMTVATVEAPVTTLASPSGPPNRVASENAQRQGFGFFGKKQSQQLPGGLNKSMTMNMSTPAVPEAPSTLFGSDLVERADYERRQIPSVVTRCIEEVELRGMDIEGIYRKTGGNSQVKMIQEGLDKDEDFDISDPALDITAVTSVLKQYFRKLPNPLLTFEVYERILESNTIQDETDRCVHLRTTFDTLPPKHKDCLEFLMFHLARVAQRERENLMSPKNLAVVFAPTIMRDHSLEKEMTDMHAKNLAVQFIIENSHIIFSDDALS
ncbi:putative Rho-type GTPase-activating protein [Diplogelasinospora grovesii]|uniref:Rho-type GTPase-activating protein n=1 Tax=Diplogelasinospora grovesii TaxID=303347 RepID=A0AAN6N091_9PEZI|nr:putative Rho-type GTPase-activating protein [Diplogelasinospora grovesii]